MALKATNVKPGLPIVDEGSSAWQILGLEIGAIRATTVGAFDEMVVEGEVRPTI